ncbi:MAG: Gfo/Idh/MocA family oxidoreductase [Nitrosopumilaceae archaeon]|jgi:UDP-N-acetylglucosamine 3-dehydrogenase
MKIVQIGLGTRGENFSKILAEFGVLSAVFDPDHNKSKEIGQKYSINNYHSEEQLIASEDFDGVVVGNNVSSQTPANLLYKKKHVFLEKSSQFDSIEIQKLKELSKKNKVILTWGLDERFSSSIENLKQSLKQKNFGDLIMLELYRQSTISQKNKGIIFEGTINDIDIANVIFDELPVVVFARLGYSEDENEIFASMMLGYKDNKTVVILSNGTLSEKVKKIQLFCTEAILQVDLNAEKIEISNKESLGIMEKRDTLKFQIKNFIDAIDGKSEILFSSNDMLNLTKIVEGALLSSNQGVPIYLDLK